MNHDAYSSGSQDPCAGVPGIYPWQQVQWQHCRRQIEAGKLPHALLLTGQQGLGKLDFAKYLSRTLLCERASGAKPCGTCQSCRLLVAGNHPDYQLVEAADDSRQIRIEQIRGIIEFLGLSAQLGAYKVALIHDAGIMTHNAANSLLKQLEEPPSGALLLLVTTRPSVLPVTVRSRCQVIRFPPPASAQGSAWLVTQLPGVDADTLLTAAYGEPLTALQVAGNELLDQRRRFFDDFRNMINGRRAPVAVAADWYRFDLKLITQWLVSLACDLVKVHWSDHTGNPVNPDFYRGFSGLAERIDLSSLYTIYDELLKTRELLETSLNRQLIVENLLLAWYLAASQSQVKSGK